MKNILNFSALGVLGLLVVGCTTHPDRCIDELDCGQGAYSEERTVRAIDDEAYKVSDQMSEAPAEAPVYEPEPVVEAQPEPEPVATTEPKAKMDPIASRGDRIFDERLTK